MRHLVVVNPKSFGSRAGMDTVLGGIRTYFQWAGENFLIYVSRYPRDAISVVNEHASSTNETVRVYSVGGDGILYDCLNGIVGLPNAELAVIPYGTSNDFVRSFGEDSQPVFRDISKQAKAGTIPTDVINIGVRHALNFCCAGGEAVIIHKYYEISKRYPVVSRKLGKRMYTVAAVSAFMDGMVSGQKYDIRADGKPVGGTFIGINIGNGPCYGGNRIPLPMAVLTDGFLDIITIESHINLRLFRRLYDYGKGGHQNHPGTFRYTRAREIVVSSDLPMNLNADGEAFYASKIKARVVPGAVKIVAPDGLSYQRRREDVL